MHQSAANIEADYFKTVLSIAAGTLKAATQPKRLRSLAIALAPYITLILLFAGFVIWNGGVVLGDKSNHIATLHLPQMLLATALFILGYAPYFSAGEDAEYRTIGRHANV